MEFILLRYHSLATAPRLMLAVSAAVLANAIYCLAYRYSLGDPATLAEAFSWGAINIAPWIAAIELSRHLSNAWQFLLAALLAGIASLLLGAAYAGEWPDMFDVVRRVPGAIATFSLLCAIELLRRRKLAAGPNPRTSQLAVARYDWARAAGNYVELHRAGQRPQLVRSTLARLIEQDDPGLVRIHRSIVVSPDAIQSVERSHVRLRDGTRLPIGNAHRAQLDSL